MRLKFFDTFQKLAEKETTIDLSHPITLEDLLEILKKKYPLLTPLIQQKDSAKLYTQIMFLRESHSLKLTDILKNEDTIFVVVPAVGG